MSEEQKKIESLILVALAKAFSEQAAFMIGEYRQQTKQSFNIAVKQVDIFIKTIESNLPKEHHDFLESVGDIYHNINIEIRKNEANMERLMPSVNS